MTAKNLLLCTFLYPATQAVKQKNKTFPINCRRIEENKIMNWKGRLGNK